MATILVLTYLIKRHHRSIIATPDPFGEKPVGLEFLDFARNPEFIEGLRAMSPSTLLRIVSLSNDLSNGRWAFSDSFLKIHLEFLLSVVLPPLIHIMLLGEPKPLPLI